MELHWKQRHCSHSASKDTNAADAPVELVVVAVPWVAVPWVVELPWVAVLPQADVAVTKADVAGTWVVALQMPLDSTFLDATFLESSDVVPETMSGQFSS